MAEEKFAVMQQLEAIAMELSEAEAAAQEQYEKMKLRIRYMYERGDTEYLELLLKAEIRKGSWWHCSRFIEIRLSLNILDLPKYSQK